MPFGSDNSPPVSPGEALRRAERPGNGFSLLEVLVALAVLAILGTVTLRGVHEGQDIISEDRWKDIATRMARNLLYEEALEGGEPASEGTFFPEYPAMRWQRYTRELDGNGGSRSVVLVRREEGGRECEVRLEAFDARWAGLRNGVSSSGKE